MERDTSPGRQVPCNSPSAGTRFRQAVRAVRNTRVFLPESRVVADDVSLTEGQFLVDDLGWVVSGSDVNHVVSILDRCAGKIIEWATRRGLQFDTATIEEALITRRRGHKKHLQL